MELFRVCVGEAIREAGLHPDLAQSFAWLTNLSAPELASLDYVDEVTAERHS